MSQASSQSSHTSKDDYPCSSDEKTHPFAEPWEDSDVVLVVEDEKFHVHRQILSIYSPVFKAMLSSQFREATAKEIPLPEKKANEVLDFLTQLYRKDLRAEMTLDKVEHLLKLADEYQAMCVFDICVKYLENVPRRNETVIKILYLAQSTPMARADSRVHSICEKCYDVIQNMDLKEITQTFDFKNLDRDSLEKVFMKKTNRLETFLAKLYPQFIGLVEFCIALCLRFGKRYIPCSEHFDVMDDFNEVANEELFQRVKSCLVCRKMIERLVSQSKTSSIPTSEERCYGGTLFFDEELISIVQDFHEIIRAPVTPTSHPMSGPHGPTGLGAYTKVLPFP